MPHTKSDELNHFNTQHFLNDATSFSNSQALHLGFSDVMECYSPSLSSVVAFLPACLAYTFFLRLIPRAHISSLSLSLCVMPPLGNDLMHLCASQERSQKHPSRIR